MSQFETHVYATVRVTVKGTTFSTAPRELAEKVADAVCADASQWLQPVHGSVNVEGHGSYDIGAVEFAGSIYGVLVDERDPVTGHTVAEHLFDEACAPRQANVNVQELLADVIGVLGEHPEASKGNSKVHFAMMRLKSILEG